MARGSTISPALRPIAILLHEFMLRGVVAFRRAGGLILLRHRRDILWLWFAFDAGARLDLRACASYRRDAGNRVMRSTLRAERPLAFVERSDQARAPRIWQRLPPGQACLLACPPRKPRPQRDQLCFAAAAVAMASALFMALPL